MPDVAYTQAGRLAILTTPLGVDKLILLGFTAVEKISEPFVINVDAVAQIPVDLHAKLGHPFGIEIKGEPYQSRHFHGILWEYTELERDHLGYHYQLVLRPKAALHMINKDSRIFQNKTVPDIIKAVLSDIQLTPDLTETYEQRVFCVQYQESNFDFCCRLMEHEGIYYYWRHTQSGHALMLIDNRSKHIAGRVQTVELKRVHGAVLYNEPIFSALSERRHIGPHKVSITDYDFEAPNTDLKVEKAHAKKIGSDAPKRWMAGDRNAILDMVGDVYHHSAKYKAAEKSARGARHGAVLLDSLRGGMAASYAEGNTGALEVGAKITVTEKDHTAASYTVLTTTHRYSSAGLRSGHGQSELTVQVELIPDTVQFRPPLVTPVPRIFGPQTAIVVGKAGEEIQTDQYGRILIQFHWDRAGKKDQNSSCYVRVAQSVAGKKWGHFMLPRIGQEVVVEFLEGDPDRPLVTGAVYNAENMPPVMTEQFEVYGTAGQSDPEHYGFKGESSKGGGGSNHFWFSDKKNSERISLRAEKAYSVRVVNGDETRQYDKGNRTTDILKGNDTLTIKEGARTETIQKDDALTLKAGNLLRTLDQGSETRVIKQGKRTTTIQQDETLSVKMGNRSATIDMGNDSLTVKMGNVDIKVNLGSHKTEALQAIELKCGGSTIKMDPMSIKLQSMMIEIKGSLMVKTEGLMVQSEASAISMLKGGLVLIN